ncbi:hypothetical protein SAY86_004335 [Trapa natans]|uniref:Filament-like plant protein 7 n=1 Tax=Trapa natans TaxID=22666 RepID=A0AAN7N6E9_TRANT|nr:hypothetical protein SAY86_004335 [Trapa natans]
MDPKSWRWRRRSSEKTIVTGSCDSLSTTLPLDNDRGSDLPYNSLNERLASALVDCQKKDDLIASHARAAEHAIAEFKEVEARAALLKQELDDALSQAEAANEKLNSSREESEQIKKSLEEKLSEMEKKMAFLSLENNRLSSELSGKDREIEVHQKAKSDAESQFNALMTRLDPMVKETAFLKYEYCVLEKEMSIRNEELEYNRRAADAAQQKHLESTRKIAKLEGECHRLRVLMQKRLPGPADLARMKSEVRVLGGVNQSDTRRRRKPLEAPINGTKTGLLMERLGVLEEENRALKELVSLKDADLVSSKALNSETALKLMEVEARVSELSRGQGMELVIKEPLPKESSSSPLASPSGSWANALISELEHFRTEKVRSASKSLSTDFSLAEMDSLAIVSVDQPSEKGAVKEISFDWLQVVLNAMMEQTRVSNRSLLELFEDVKIALGFMDYQDQERGKSSPGLSNKAKPVCDSETPQISGYLTWKCSSATVEGDNWRKTVQKIIELIEGFNPPSLKNSEYFVHVFQWKHSELIAVQEKFLGACNSILNEKSDLETFVQELASALDWIMSSDTTPRKNASNVRDRIKKNISMTESIGEEDPITESDSDNKAENRSSRSASVDQGDNKILELEPKKMEPAGSDMEARLKKAEECIGGLTLELVTIKELKRAVEDQLESQKLLNGDLQAQLTDAKSKLNEVYQKVSSLEVELEEKNNCCEELESTCLELQLQLESVAKETPQHQELTLSRTGWEITAATVKLAECQETILNLGRQLKEMSSPRDTAFLERVFSKPNTCRNLKMRPSLRDRMLAEDNVPSPHIHPKPTEDTGLNHSTAGALAVVPVPSRKRTGIGFFKRLLLRRRRGSGRRSTSLQKT